MSYCSAAARSVLLVVLFAFPAFAENGARDLFNDTWVATDALGRTLPGYAECGPPREGRTVGLFYFLWLGEHGTGGPYDITEILAANPDDPQWGPGGEYPNGGAPHHWGESELGYYLSSDDYVMRKHAHMLADADVDVIFFDVTNGWTYRSKYLALCSVFTQIRAEGGTTPQIAFLAYAYADQSVQGIYNDLYSKNLYSDLWFYWKGKPLVLAPLHGMEILGRTINYSSAVRDFFNMRYTWAWTGGQGTQYTWNWIDNYPQKYGTGESSSIPEEVSVCAGHHANSNKGRSYHNNSQPSYNQYHLTGYEHLGLNFDEQWSRLNQIDPELVFITGWNEWTQQRYIVPEGQQFWFLGKLVGPGETFFVDSYNQEFSRDIEPMKGGHTDNYYYQMIAGIRRYKGVRPPPEPSPAAMVTLGGYFDWTAVEPEFRDTVYDTTHRNQPGWGSAGPYVNTTGRNDFVTMKVAYDGDNIYFYAETREPITPWTDPYWMLLFIDADQDHSTGWHGYDYLVNLSVLDSTTTTLRHSPGGWNWTQTAELSYAVSGNKLEIRIPRSALGLAENPSISFDFKWADNIQHEDDIIEFAVSGDSAPNRRFNYRYDNGIYACLFNTDGDFEGWVLLHSLGDGVVADGVLSCTITGVDPYMVRGPVKLNPTLNRYLHLRMKNGTTGNTASFYWVTDKDSSWSESKSVHFPIVPSDTNFRDYLVDLTQHPNWTDTITWIRVDPVGGNTSSGHTAIDRIAFSSFIPGDFDGDGVPDEIDNCPDVPNPLVPYEPGDSYVDCAIHLGLVQDGLWQPDYDCDGVGDACDACPNTIPGAQVDAIGCPPPVPGDFDRDGDVDLEDFGFLQRCYSSAPVSGECLAADLNDDGVVNQADFAIFRACLSGSDVPADPNCAD